MFNNWEKKEKPIQGMMGMGGGATGYLAGGSTSAGSGILRYLDRTVASSFNNTTTKPGQLPTNTYTQGWGHSGGNADGLIINVSGSGTYNLYSISIGSQGASPGDTFTHTLYLRVETGSTTGSGTLLLNTSASYTLGFSGDRWHELVLPTPVTLDRGTSYFIGYGVAQGDPFPNSNSLNSTWYIGSNATTSLNVTTSDGSSATMTIGSPVYGDSDPWDASNSTDSTRGTIPIIGIEI